MMVVIKVLIFCFNFSGMALNVQASTGRKSMLNSCKNILHNRQIWRAAKLQFGCPPKTFSPGCHHQPGLGATTSRD